MARPPIGPDGKPCSPKLPLLLYYDDYLGNEQRGLIQTRSFSKAVGVLSDYYGFGVMSYADAGGFVALFWRWCRSIVQVIVCVF